MAEYVFCIQSVKTSIKYQTITVIFSLDVDEETITSDNISVVNVNTQALLPYTIETEKKKVTIKLKDWALPNTDYLLTVQPEVSSIVGDKLEYLYEKTIAFQSDVVSDVEIISPKNFDKISDSLAVKWKETGETLTNYYYYEVSTENAFFNVISKGTLDFTSNVSQEAIYETVLSDITENGQYYIRIRAIQGNCYGFWSAPITFTIGVPEEPQVVDPEPETVLPEIADLTNLSAAEITKEIEKFFTAQTEFFEDSPTSFEINCNKPIQNTGYEVTVERKTV